MTSLLFIAEFSTQNHELRLWLYGVSVLKEEESEKRSRHDKIQTTSTSQTSQLAVLTVRRRWSIAGRNESPSCRVGIKTLSLLAMSEISLSSIPVRLQYMRIEVV